jgi:hypothetical protein
MKKHKKNCELSTVFPIELVRTSHHCDTTPKTIFSVCLSWAICKKTRTENDQKAAFRDSLKEKKRFKQSYIEKITKSAH